jgi:hypothetical protein
VIRVLAIAERRGSFQEAQLLYEEQIVTQGAATTETSGRE